MNLLTRDQILQAADLAREVVHVPEWNGDVLVQALNGRERDAYETSIMQLRGTDAHVLLENARAKLVARAIVDENGQRIFSDEDVKQLATKSAAALQRVYDVAARLCGLTRHDLDELTKNSVDGQRDASLSD